MPKVPKVEEGKKAVAFAEAKAGQGIQETESRGQMKNSEIQKQKMEVGFKPLLRSAKIN